MFLVTAGVYSDYHAVAYTEDENMAKTYCAMRNGSPYVCDHSYGYIEVQKLDDIFKMPEKELEINISSSVYVRYDKDGYSFSLGGSTEVARYDGEVFNSSGVVDEFDDLNFMDEYEILHISEFEWDDSITYTVSNFVCSKGDEEHILRVFQDNWFQWLNMTDGVVDVKTWNNHFKALAGLEV